MGGFLDIRRTQRRFPLIIFTIILGALSLFYLGPVPPPLLPKPRPPETIPLSRLGISVHNQATTSLPVKPNDIRVIGLIFFGRQDRVQILKCYLERNLVSNGGWLDEVHWVRNTAIEEDVAYLHDLVASNPAYKQIEIQEMGFVGYGLAWTTLEENAIYVKIDDDVVFMADDTIPRVVSTKLAHPEYLVVSANMINSPLMGWVHYHMGAIHPYLPELIEPEDVRPDDAFDRTKRPPPKRVPWRYTQHPHWVGPDDYFFSFEQEPPSLHHRWLRLGTDVDNVVAQLKRTPISDAQYATWGNSVQSWAIAAQQHYSFLENLLDDQLDRYQFSSKAMPWITDYQRLSINFIAINSTEILSHLPMDTVDEEWLTVVLPKKIGKSVAVDTHALANHFSFGGQGSVQTTDLLGRYLDYAQERACLSSTPEMTEPAGSFSR